MNVKNLSLGLPVALAAGIFCQVNAAEAAVFSIGDILNISDGVFVTNSVNNFSNLAGTAESLGNYGNFGVTVTSSGGFTPFISGGTVLPSYQIQSVDFAADLTGVQFLQANLPDNSDGFIFEITSPITGAISTIGSGFTSAYNFRGAFKDIDSGEILAFGEAIFTAQGFASAGKDSYSATFIVDQTVPEPATAFAVLSMVGALAVRRRQQPVA